jgi:hypothetical protein
MSDVFKPVKVQGELFWASFMSTFNTKFDEENNKYECCLGGLSEAAVKALEGQLGIKVKDRDPMGRYVVAKSKYVFEPVDEDGNKIDITKIGNGTKVVALVSSYRHKMSSKFGASPSIRKLIVTDLKTYNPEGSVEEENDDIL